MSLTSNAYKLTITERGRLALFLEDELSQANDSSKQNTIDGHLFNKFKAALLYQDALDFPCLLDEPIV